VSSRAINGVAQAVTYDVLGRTPTVTNALGVFQYTYVGATPRPASKAYPNGQTTLYAYYNNAGDERLQLIQHLYPNGSLLSAFGYSYNAVGQITSLTNQWDTFPTRMWLPSYDAADQLTNVASVAGPSGATSYDYAYDPAENRTLSQINNVPNRFNHNALNQLTGATPGPTNSVTYEWDAADRLTAINQGTHRSEFSYDGLGRRVRIVEKDNGMVSLDNYFVWCWSELCEERDASAATVVRRFFSQGEMILGAGGSTNLFYTRDHLGSIREAVDSSGALQARYDYDPFGQQAVLTETLNTTFAFTGDFQHRPSGLYFAFHRAFDPGLGRWLSPDPLEERAGLNFYAYVSNNPLNGTDRSGLDGDPIAAVDSGTTGVAPATSYTTFVSTAPPGAVGRVTEDDNAAYNKAVRLAKLVLDVKEVDLADYDDLFDALKTCEFVGEAAHGAKDSKGNVYISLGKYNPAPAQGVKASQMFIASCYGQEICQAYRQMYPNTQFSTIDESGFDTDRTALKRDLVSGLTQWITKIASDVYKADPNSICNKKKKLCILKGGP
jgi:RHS repeat-associated protein